MEIFRFRRFDVRNERSAMKVNTDGVLLGALMTLMPGDRSLLDVGTGTGTIALMAAQRLAEISDFNERFTPDLTGKSSDVASIGPDLPFRIIGIDIDKASAEEASYNFAASPWSNGLSARHISLEDFESEISPDRHSLTGSGIGLPVGDGDDRETGRFDVIFSNPPYFESSLKAPDPRRRTARHADTMSYREIIAFASRHLTVAGDDCGKMPEEMNGGNGMRDRRGEITGGRLSLIVPYDTEREVVRYAASFGLGLFRRVRVMTTLRRGPSRSVLEFAIEPQIASAEDDEMIIQNGSEYTAEYRALMKDFLLL